jgi:hypothetical protein
MSYACLAQCHADNRVEFGTEMSIHLSGLSNVSHPGVLAFPKVTVCLDCGFSTFAVQEAELMEQKETQRLVPDGSPAKSSQTG